MRLDIIRIPESREDISPVRRLVMSLGLPELHEHTMLYTACRSEPNPIGPPSSRTRRDPANDPCGYLSRPFLSNPEEAIIHITFLVFDATNDRFSAALIVHRKSILALIPGIKAAGKTSNKNASAVSSDEEISSLLSPSENSTSPPPSSPLSTATTSTAAFPTYKSLQWDAWGPPIARWLPTNGLATRWITVTSGQRFTTIASDATSHPAPVCVYDFNPRTVRRVKQALARGERPFGISSGSSGSGDGGDGGLEEGEWDIVVHDEMDMLDGKTKRGVEVFDSVVSSGLPYVLSKSKEKFIFDAVMMDDDRILGIHVSLPFFLLSLSVGIGD
jgi:hypothetical protein